MTYTVTEINDPREFSLLEPEWNLLHAQSYRPLPFTRHEWFRLWWEHFAGTNRLSVLIVRKGARLVAAMPLMEAPLPFSCGARIQLQSLTNFHSYWYRWLVAAGEEAAALEAWDYLRRRERAWTLVQLRGLSTDDPVCQLLTREVRRQGHPVGVWPAYESPSLPIQGRWDDFLAGLKPKFRSNLRNRRRRLEALGDVRIERVLDPSDVPAALEEGFRIEQAGWKGERGSAIACRPELVGFYTRWAEIAADRKWLRLFFLSVGGKRIAFDYTVAFENRLYCMKIGYDPAFGAYSPGQLLCAEVLKRCHDEGIDGYEFLGGSNVQKRDWNPRHHQKVWLYLYNRSMAARLHHASKFLVKQQIKRWWLS